MICWSGAAMKTDSRSYIDDKDVGLVPFVPVVLSSALGLYLPESDRFELLRFSYLEARLLTELARQGPDTPTGALERVVQLCQDQKEITILNNFMTELGKRELLNAAPRKPVGGAPGKIQPCPAAKAVFPQGEALEVLAPLVMQVSGWGFDVVDHDGNKLARLAPSELVMLASFADPVSCWKAHARHCQEHLGRAAAVEDFKNAVLRFWRLGLLRIHQQAWSGPEATDGKEQSMNSLRGTNTRGLEQHKKQVGFLDQYMARFEQRHRAIAGAFNKTRVIPVNGMRGSPPLALGMLIAYASARDDGRLQEDYLFVPDWQPRNIRLDRYAKQPAIYLFSSYIWSHEVSLTLSARIKAANPRSLTVHGGPQAPKYPGDVEAYFRDHPHVDVVVHGEGEETFSCLLDALGGKLELGDKGLDLSALKHVPGLSYRDGERVVRTAPRSQVKDLDSLPSPYLDGTFDVFEHVQPTSVIIETNRGCPYGCTFCDWGSATASKVRRFSLERVFAELEWCARAGVDTIFVADANFGMFERDVQIAEKVAELKQRYGYPLRFGTNYAKNKIKYLSRIVRVLIEADILTEGLLSLQSMDEQTLAAIDRSNIKTEKYDELAREFRKAGLPLYVDIMVGLPGSTRESFAEDLQQCIDREVSARMHQTELLVNSPMNAPAYREKYRIKTATAARGRMSSRLDNDNGLGRMLVVETATFTREDYDWMLDLLRLFKWIENQGVLRQVSRHIRHVSGYREVDFIRDLRQAGRCEAERWPHLAFVLTMLPHIMAPPVSWRFFIDEIHRFVLERYAVPDDSALRTVLEVQHALLPTTGRRFPLRINLAHDYAAWHRAMVSAKDAGAQADWPQQVPPLSSYPPAVFEVSDPLQVCELNLGVTGDHISFSCWEMLSPVARNLPPGSLDRKKSA